MRLTPPGRRIFRVAQFRVQARDVVFSSPSLRAAGFLNSAASRLSLSLDALLHLRRAVVLFEWLRSCLNTSLSFFWRLCVAPTRTNFQGAASQSMASCKTLHLTRRSSPVPQHFPRSSLTRVGHGAEIGSPRKFGDQQKFRVA
jgi:hypothetical protein